jgi:hypothetical protein
MGKKKRQFRSRVTQRVFGRLEKELEEARTFFESATPLEVSTALTEIGISTAHRSGIAELLDQATQHLLDPTPITGDRKEYLLHALTDRWIVEICRKGHGSKVRFEDRVFLIEAAQHCVVNWAEAKDHRNPGFSSRLVVSRA